jgi:predicted aspartyl protease
MKKICALLSGGLLLAAQTCFAENQSYADLSAPHIKTELATLSENGRTALRNTLIACSLYVAWANDASSNAKYLEGCKIAVTAFKLEFSGKSSFISIVLENAIIVTQIWEANRKLYIQQGQLPPQTENPGKNSIEALQKIYRDTNLASRVGVQEGQRRIPSSGTTPSPSASILIPLLQEKGGTYVVPVLINKAITLNFVIDSGASDVSIPADVVMTLVRAGTIQDTDFIGRQTYKLADGSSVPSATFRIRSLTMNKLVIENVKGSVASAAGDLLLGQSFLSRFKSWSIDNAKQALVLNR